MPSKPVTVTLLLPTMNEVVGFKQFYEQIDKSLFDDILVVDGGSKDGTAEYAMSQGVRVMTQLRKGLAFAVLDAVHSLETDCVIEFSMDGNCLPEQLPQIVGLLKEGYDLVGISRYLPPAKSEDDTLITAFGNWMFSKMIRFMGSYPITDALNMYRGFHKKIVHYPEFEAFLYGPVFEPLTSAVATVRKLKIIEIPGDEPKRVGGFSKMSILYNGSCILLMVARMYLFKFGILRFPGKNSAANT
jgi:glycosyltransferase involved in cell wall biosynthesis